MKNIKEVSLKAIFQPLKSVVNLVSEKNLSTIKNQENFKTFPKLRTILLMRSFIQKTSEKEEK